MEKKSTDFFHDHQITMLKGKNCFRSELQGYLSREMRILRTAQKIQKPPTNCN